MIEPHLGLWLVDGVAMCGDGQPLMVLQCPDGRQYVLDRDSGIALGVSLLSCASKLFPPHGGAFREAVRAMFAVLDDPPAAEETTPQLLQRLTPPQAARS